MKFNLGEQLIPIKKLMIRLILPLFQDHSKFKN